MKKHLISFWIIFFTVLNSGCIVKMYVNPEYPKQGDNLNVRVHTSFSSNVTEVKYRINEISNTVTTPGFSVNYPTCKSSGTYKTSLNLWAEATWENGNKRYFNKTYNLTESSKYRENSSLNYVFYVARDLDDGLEGRMQGIAESFIDEFESYSSYHYYWAETWHFNTNGLNGANKYDLALAIGHGGHHTYNGVDLSNTSYGAFYPCSQVGDVEYLAFISCQTLSMNNFGGNEYWHYWINQYSTRFDKRPFHGLHMVCGFRTDFVNEYSIIDSDGEDFTEAFAENLDDNMTVKDAWLEAAGDELDMGTNKNLAAVLYMRTFENDRRMYKKGDYIYLNPNYLFSIERWTY